jgi:hypothetical protein
MDPLINADLPQTFRNPKAELLAALESTGGALENGVKKTTEPSRKRGKKDKNVSCACLLSLQSTKAN